MTSQNPQAASGAAPVWPADLQPGQPVEVAPGVVRLIAPNAGLFTGPGTNTYVIGSGPLAVVDPGPDDDAHLEALCEAVADRLRWILVTHTHSDHSPLAGRLREATGAAVIGFGPVPQQVHQMSGPDSFDRAFSPDSLLADGDRLDAADFAIEAVYTPGHASNHLCFDLVGSGLLFSGDHVMSASTVVIPPPDGDMALYMESLEKVRARPLRTIAPGHGALIPDPAAVLDGYLRHRREREQQVLAGLAAASIGGVTAQRLVEAIYVDVPKALHPAARSSVWAHLRKLAAEGRATSSDVDDIDAPWTLVATAS